VTVRTVKPTKANTPKFMTPIFKKLFDWAPVDEVPVTTCTSAATHAIQRKLRRMLLIENFILYKVCPSKNKKAWFGEDSF